MRAIRRKSAAIFTRPYIKHALGAGLPLSWDAYERMLPQDGFSLLGLSCHDCLMGPCRINPFERSEGCGVCGLSRDAMALRSLRRAAALPTADDTDIDAALASILDDAAAALPPLSGGDTAGSIEVGLGALDDSFVNIAISGISLASATKLAQKAAGRADIARAAGAAKGFNITSIAGLYADAGICAASSAGNAEPALLTGLVDACVMAPGHVCRARMLSGRVHTYFCVLQEPADQAALDALLQAAADAYAKRGDALPCADKATLTYTPPSTADATAYSGVCMLGGSANVKQTQSGTLCDAACAALDAGAIVYALGDAAVQLAECGVTGGGLRAVAHGDTRALLALLQVLPGRRKCVCFPSLCTPEDVRTMLALSSAAQTLYCTHLPVDGSQAVLDALAQRIEHLPPETIAARISAVLGGDVRA